MLALAFRCSSFETDSDWRIHFEVVPRNSFGEDEAHEAEADEDVRGRGGRNEGDTSKGWNVDTSKGRNGETSKGRNGETSKGRKGETSKGWNGEMNKGRTGETSKSWNGEESEKLLKGFPNKTEGEKRRLNDIDVSDIYLSDSREVNVTENKVAKACDQGQIRLKLF